MQPTTLAEELAHGAQILGVSVEFNYTVSLDDQTQLFAFARFPSLGAANGMLIFTGYEQVKPYWSRLADLGFGFSVLDEITGSGEFDVDAFREMLIDWGWSDVK